MSSTAELIARTSFRGGTVKILAGVFSKGPDDPCRKTACETWLMGLDPGAVGHLFVGPGEDDGVQSMPGNDRYVCDGLAILRRFLLHALAEFDFEWLFVCRGDSYVAIDRLVGLVSPELDLIHPPTARKGEGGSGSAAFLISRQLVKELTSDPGMFVANSEAEFLAATAARCGSRASVSRRLAPGREGFPRPDNDLVISCPSTPDGMRAVHAISRGPVETVSIVHPYWSDRVLLSPDGYFARRSTGCRGRWSKTDDGILCLQWFSWAMENFHPNHRSGSNGLRPPVFSKCVETKVSTLTMRLTGGLGNQMFQYAHGLALARRLDVRLRLEFIDLGRPFALGIFGIALDTDRVAGPEERFDCHGGYDGRPEWPCLTAAKNGGAPHLIVSGYFQNESLFSPFAGDVREIFKLDPGPLPDGFEGRTAVCVQVRRGDFVGHPGHDVCSTGYFIEAMKLARQIVESPSFIVISDDPEWCSSCFGDLPDVTVAPYQDTLAACRTMAACQAFIISNSTFGWWGAWLYATGPVIAPDRFLSNSQWDVYPPGWILIPPDGSSGVSASELSARRKETCIPREIPENRFAEPFDDRPLKDEWQLGVYLYASGLVQYLSLPTVIDVGCGSGYKLRHCFGPAVRTIGIEDNGTTLDFLRESYPDASWIATGERPPCEGEALVISADVIEHTADPVGFMEYLLTLPWRHALISTPTRDPACIGAPGHKNHFREWAFDEFAAFLAQWADDFRVNLHALIHPGQRTQMAWIARGSFPQITPEPTPAGHPEDLRV